MLTLDTSTQAKWRGAAKKESSHESLQTELAAEIRSNTITVAPDADRDITNLQARMGRPMSSKDVIDRLKKCNSNFVFERSNADATKMGVYIMRDEKLPTGGFEKKKMFLCGMEAAYMPEFNIVHKTAKQVPNPELLGNAKPVGEVNWISVDTYGGETRGWRTVLVRLMHQNLINRHQVEKYFGWAPTHQSQHWHTLTN